MPRKPDPDSGGYVCRQCLRSFDTPEKLTSHILHTHEQVTA